MKLGLLQLHITADIADNKTRLAEGIIDLAKRGAELIVLQELHNTLYFCQVEDVENFDLAEPIPGPSTEFYGKLAKDLGGNLELAVKRIAEMRRERKRSNGKA